jgi:hypothetical protein
VVGKGERLSSPTAQIPFSLKPPVVRSLT